MARSDELLKDLGLDVDLHRRIFDAVDRNFRETVLAQKIRPARMAYFDGVIHEAHGGRVREIIERRAAGDKLIGTFCIYVPRRDRAGPRGDTRRSLRRDFSVHPLRREAPAARHLSPGQVDRRPGPVNTCPYSPIEDLAVGETTCDAKKRHGTSLWRRTAISTSSSCRRRRAPGIRDLWFEGGSQSKSRLQRLTGRTLDPEKARRRCPSHQTENGGRLARLNALRKEANPPPERPTRLVVSAGRPPRRCRPLHAAARSPQRRGSRTASAGIRPVASERAKRIMISGCLGPGQLEAPCPGRVPGAIVVCDETCTGSRYYENLVEEDRSGLEARIAAIADRYLKIECSCFSPNDERIDSILRLAREHRVDGVVQYVLQYCHTYNVEAVAVAAALKDARRPQPQGRDRLCGIGHRAAAPPASMPSSKGWGDEDGRRARA